MSTHMTRTKRQTSSDATTQDAADDGLSNRSPWRWRDEMLYILIPIAIVAAIVVFEIIMNSMKWGLTR